MKIVLATLHVRRSAQAVPLAAACLAAALPEPFRSDVQLVDLFLEQNTREMCDLIQTEKPDLVAFPMYSWNRQAVLDVCQTLREQDASLRTVVGGPEASADACKILAVGSVDTVIVGEGEFAFAELVQALDREEPWQAIAGLAWFDNGQCRFSPPREPAAELTDYPSPWLTGLLPPAQSGVLWEVARGCPFNCDFCFDSRGVKGPRYFSWERLEAELDLFVKAGVAQIWVLDSTFNFPPERGKKLLRLLQRKAPYLHFHLEAKAEFFDRETARLLSGFPCSVQIGLQSARPKVLRKIHRSLDLDMFKRKVHLLNMEQVTFGFDLMLGLPGDDLEGFRFSVRTALDLFPNQVEIFPLAVLPGTPLFHQKEALGIEAHPDAPYEIISTPTFSVADLQKGRQLARAVDIFYNSGRAVGFFAALCEAAELDAVAFLDAFINWAQDQPDITEDLFLAPGQVQPPQILGWQKRFLANLFAERQCGHLVAAADDLLDYHFYYAETLLGPETLPMEPERLRGLDAWKTPLLLNPLVRLVSFHYEIVDLLEMGELRLEPFANMFRPVGSVALFLRRGDEVVCESLQEDFLLLLRQSDGKHSPQEIFYGEVPADQGREMVDFALAEGLLLPAGSSDQQRGVKKKR